MQNDIHYDSNNDKNKLDGYLLLTHFSPMLHFTQKLVTCFAEQNKIVPRFLKFC